MKWFRIGLPAIAALSLRGDVEGYETVEDAAIIARELVDQSSAIGTMATVYPQSHPTLSGQPFSLPVYYSSCFTNGSLTLILLPISRHTQNVLASPRQQVSISVNSPVPDASRPRVSLLGNITIFKDVDSTPELSHIKQCYLSSHADAKGWLPGDRRGAHLAWWARFDPETIYFVGGFGDSHYIGDIPKALFQDATKNLHISVAGRLLVQQY